ncbi:MAG: hypothetical protein RIQ60_2752 [Pseudomonadota bacterium]|jgi:predicted ATPase/DNA-binding winged helix-turn-helix (wHTH) protein
MNDASTSTQLSRLSFGRVELRLDERRLLVAGQTVAIGARAYDLLVALVERRDRMVTKNELLDLVWPDRVVEESNLPVHVSALRKALGGEAISTIPGRGYRFTLAGDEATTTAPVLGVPAGKLPVGAAISASPLRPGDKVAGKLSHEHSAPAGGHAADLNGGLSGGGAGGTVEVLHNLPPESGPLIGRDTEVAAITGLLADQRLVSIVGAGGLGKTRLARAVARSLTARQPGGVWWVDLSAVTEDEQVARCVAQALGAPLGESGAARQLARSLALRPATMLVLDNCEQVARGVAALAELLLDASPLLRLLCTSQTPLHTATEQVWRLDTLAVPPPHAPLDEARRHAAYALFEHRAHAGDQRFRMEDSGSVALAIELCRHLDGNALAIEMAAARAAQIGLAGLVDRLGDRLRMLRASQHGQPSRHASLRATLDWSCTLLGETQRVVLRRLAVFAGSFDLDCAQQVAALDDTPDAADPIDAWSVLDALAELVDHSLLQITDTPAGPRYRLAETTRLYAAERLAAAGEARAVEQRLRAAMAALARRAAAGFWALTHDAFLSRHGPDQANLQLAFDSACRAPDVATAAATGCMLAVLDHLRGIVAGTRERMAAARPLLELTPPASRLRGELLDLLAPVSSIALPGISRLALARERSSTWAMVGDRPMAYLALRALAAELARAGLADEAQRCAQQLADFEADRADVREVAGNVPPLPSALLIEGAQLPFELAQYGVVVAGPASVPAGAVPLRASAEGLQRGLALARAMGDTRRSARLLYLLADEATAHGEPAAAIELCQSAIAAQQPLLRPATLGMAWSNLCAAQLLAGDVTGARGSAARALPLLRPQHYANVLFNHLALLAARDGQAELGARLLGHADRWYAANQTPARQAIEARVMALTLPSLTEALGPTRLAGLRAEGASLDEALADALATPLLQG